MILEILTFQSLDVAFIQRPLQLFTFLLRPVPNLNFSLVNFLRRSFRLHISSKKFFAWKGYQKMATKILSTKLSLALVNKICVIRTYIQKNFSQQGLLCIYFSIWASSQGSIVVSSIKSNFMQSQKVKTQNCTFSGELNSLVPLNERSLRKMKSKD